MQPKLHRLVSRALALSALASALCAAALSGVTPAAADSATAVPAPNKTITTSSVGMQMFMWPWVSLATECKTTLGPEGMDWILVSPPQEDVQGAQWWTHYQPVSYQINSQLGTEAQFAAMVSACNSAGVQVIVDAVINHMASGSGTGFAGTNHSKYSYPGLYSETDFHAGLAPTDPNFCDKSIANYNDPFQVVHCELGGLSDLATEKPSVQATIAGYFNHLTDLGVAGFRIDAAKHVGITDLTAIRSLLKPVNGKPPYFLSETVGGAAENQPFTAIGDVFAWDYQAALTHVFNGSFSLLADQSQRAAEVGAAANTVIMVSNHDTEHHGPTAVTYKDPQKYLAASAYLLADPLGKPMLYTGYAFDDFLPDLGPATSEGTTIAPAVCPKGALATKPQKSYKNRSFICMDRWTAIAGMIQWHHEVAAAEQATGNTSGANAKLAVNKNLLTLTRGSGFFALNGNQAAAKRAITTTVATSLPAGVYCDVVSGGAKAVRAGKCVGKSVTVATNGNAKLAISPMTALAIDAANKLH